MSLLEKLVNRGSAVINEWNTRDKMDEASRVMIAEIAASTLVKLCGREIRNWDIEKRRDMADAITIALNSAFQIGRTRCRLKKRKKT